MVRKCMLQREPFVEQSEITTFNEEMISGVQQEWFRHDITNSELWSSLCNFNTGSVRRVRFLFSYFKISRSFEVCLTSDLGFLFLTLCDGRKCLGTRLSCFCCCCCCFRDIGKQTKHTGIIRSCNDILTFLLYFCGFGGILRGAFWLDS